MFRKSLILLTTTAILLPMNAVSASMNERAYRDQERASPERAQRSRGERSDRQSRSSRQRSTSSSARKVVSSPRQEAAKQPVVQPRRARDTAVRDRGSSQGRQRSVAPSRSEGTFYRDSNRVVRQSTVQTKTVTKTRRAVAPDRGNVRSTQRVNAGRTREQVINNERRSVRDGGRATTVTSTQRSVTVRRHDGGNYTRSRASTDSRRVIRGSANDYGRPASRTRALDYARDHAYRGNDNWDRGRVRDRRRGNYRRDWWYRNRWDRDVDIYFGFSPYYTGFGFNVGYHGGYYNAYHNGHYYGRNYYFGHWPLTSGYYHRRASWLWNHHHHHYHYGEYCPHAHNNVHVTYYDDYDSGYYSSSSSGNKVAGMLLGGIVGGIIGAEIDGGRDKTAGAVIGSVLGAAIGASAASDSDVTHYPSSGVVYDASGRHAYETETYEPPREIRTCMRYETRQGEYVCTKWTVEYEYDDWD